MGCTGKEFVIYLSIHLSIHLYIYISIYLSIYLSIRTTWRWVGRGRSSWSIYLYIFLSICLSIYLSIYLSIRTTWRWVGRGRSSWGCTPCSAPPSSPRTSPSWTFWSGRLVKSTYLSIKQTDLVLLFYSNPLFNNKDFYSWRDNFLFIFYIKKYS